MTGDGGVDVTDDDGGDVIGNDDKMMMTAKTMLEADEQVS